MPVHVHVIQQNKKKPAVFLRAFDLDIVITARAPGAS